MLKLYLQKDYAHLAIVWIMLIPLQGADGSRSQQDHALSTAKAAFGRQALALDATRQLRPELTPATATRLARAAAANIIERGTLADLSLRALLWVRSLRRLLAVRGKGKTPPAPIMPQPRVDLENLLTRIDHHLYPETLEIMTAYWFKTLRTKLFKEKNWRRLGKLIQRQLASEALSGPHRRMLEMVAQWIPSEIAAMAARVPYSAANAWLPEKAGDEVRSDEWLRGYLTRLLNEWLPLEIARRLEKDREDSWMEQSHEEIAARALDEIVFPDIVPADAEFVDRFNRILYGSAAPDRGPSRRSRLSQEDIEALLRVPMESTLVHPKLRELLNDILLYFLRRTGPAPVFGLMPVRSLYAYGGAEMPEDLAESIARAQLLDNEGALELYVSLSDAQKVRFEEFHDNLFKGAVLISPDGTTWAPQRWEIGATTSQVFRPSGRIGLLRRPNALELIVTIAPIMGEFSLNSFFARDVMAFGYRWRQHNVEAAYSQTRIIFRAVEGLPAPKREPGRAPPLSARPALHATGPNPFLTEVADAFSRWVARLQEALDPRPFKKAPWHWQELQSTLCKAWQMDVLTPFDNIFLTKPEREVGQLLFNFLRLIEDRNRQFLDNQIAFVGTSLDRLRNWVYPIPLEGSPPRIRKIPWNVLPTKIQSLIYQARLPEGSLREVFRQPLEDIFTEIPALDTGRVSGQGPRPAPAVGPRPKGRTPPESGHLRSA